MAERLLSAIAFVVTAFEVSIDARSLVHYGKVMLNEPVSVSEQFTTEYVPDNVLPLSDPVAATSHSSELLGCILK